LSQDRFALADEVATLEEDVQRVAQDFRRQAPEATRELDEALAVEVTCDLKFINHSDRPNACYYDDLSVVALRDIETGEEITHDYACGDW